MYISDLVGSATRPVRELKGFELIELRANEKKTVSFEIDAQLLQYYTDNNKWEAESGDFKIFIGGNSDASLSTDFKFEN
jgi:beta-glucosidase